MPTCTAQMPINPPGKRTAYSTRSRPAFTLAEAMVVIVVASLLVVTTVINLMGLLNKNTFRAQMQHFISTMQMAATSAAQSHRRYEVIIDLGEQSYLLRQITNPDLSEVLEEEIIVESDFGSNCQVVDVLFDDGDYTNQGKAKFRAGRSGWQYGGRIVLLDSDGQPYSVLVNRLGTVIKLHPGEVEFLAPRLKSEMLF